MNIMHRSWLEALNKELSDEDITRFIESGDPDFDGYKSLSGSYQIKELSSQAHNLSEVLQRVYLIASKISYRKELEERDLQLTLRYGEGMGLVAKAYRNYSNCIAASSDAKNKWSKEKAYRNQSIAWTEFSTAVKMLIAAGVGCPPEADFEYLWGQVK